MFKILPYQKEVFEKGKSKPLVIVHGEEEYLKKTFLGKLKETYGDSLRILWGDEAEPLHLYELSREGSIFSARTDTALVILEAEAFLKKFSRGKKKAEELKRRLKNLKGGHIFFFFGTKLTNQDLAKEPLKSLSALGDVVLADSLSLKKVKDIVRRKLEREGGGIEESALELLVGMCHGDLMVLKQEVEKLIAYAGKERVTEEIVRKVCFHWDSSSLFDLLDAFYGKDLQGALRSFKSCVLQGLLPLQILASLTGYGVKLYFIRLFLKKGERLEKAMEKVGIKHGFMKMKFKKFLDLWKEEELKALLQKLYRAELSIKAYFSDPQRELQNLIVKALS